MTTYVDREEEEEDDDEDAEEEDDDDEEEEEEEEEDEDQTNFSTLSWFWPQPDRNSLPSSHFGYSYEVSTGLSATLKPLRPPHDLRHCALRPVLPPSVPLFSPSSRFLYLLCLAERVVILLNLNLTFGQGR